MIRRMKRTVLTQLPAKRRSHVFLHVSPIRLKALRAMTGVLASQRTTIHHTVLLDGIENNLLYMKMWRETGLAKIEAVKEYLVDLFHSEEGMTDPDPDPDLDDDLSSKQLERSAAQIKPEGNEFSEEPRKCLVFAHHQQVLDDLQTLFLEKASQSS